MIQLIFAHCNGIFGYKDELPWNHVPGDLKNFKDITTGTTLIMGPKTFMSLAKPLPGREHIVFVDDVSRSTDSIKTKDGSYPSKIIQTDFETLKRSNLVFSVIGGAELLNKAYPYADFVHITRIHSRYLKQELFDNPEDVIHLPKDFMDKINSLDGMNGCLCRRIDTEDYILETWA